MINHPKQSRITDERKRVVIEGLVRSTPRAATEGITLEEADSLYPRKSTVYTKTESDTRFAPAPIRHRQLTPSTTWGPILHPFGRPASVETIGPLGEEYECAVKHNIGFSGEYESVTINFGFAIAGEAIIS